MKDLLKYSGFLTVLISISFLGGCNKNPSSKIIKTEGGSALGTTYTIKYETDNKSINLKPEIESIFKKVNKSMSTYLPDSDISRINKGDTTIVADDYFREVYLKAKEVWQNTNGAFDPTVGALVNAWGFGPGSALKKMTQKQVDSLLGFTGFDKVSISGNGRIIKKHKALYLDFNALAKGYTLDLIGLMFNEKKIENYLIELGGEIVARGINPKTMKKWVVAIENPIQKENKRAFIIQISLKDKAMATSGNYRKFRIDEETGMRYVHTINPKTGYPQKSNVLSVSVIAATCMEADAYATAFMVMKLEKTKTLLKQLTHIEAYIVSTDGNGNLISYKTKGFKELMGN